MNYGELTEQVKRTWPLAMMRLSATPGLDQARGAVEGITAVNKFGRNLDVDTAYEPVVESGVLNLISAADEVRIKVGGDAADTAAGTGAREIEIQGIDENLDIATATIVTAGASASALTTTKFLRVFRALVTKAGSGEINAGAIIIETEAGTELLTVAADLGQSQQAHHFTPRDHAAYIHHMRFSVPSSFDCDFRLYIRGPWDDAAPARRVIREYPGVDTTVDVDLSGLPLRIPPKYDFWIEAKGSGLNQKASSEFDFALVNES